LATLTTAQTYPKCTMETANSHDCAAVIDTNACYNKFRWNEQILRYIDGAITTQVCECCTCVGRVMWFWGTQQKLC
ncbi:hypothetical protein COCVIDRAFT_70585, partial [Bipolaris victoriae FI3]